MTREGKGAELINGGVAVDDRGQVSFVNDFGFKDVKRFYMVSNHEQGLYVPGMLIKTNLNTY